MAGHWIARCSLALALFGAGGHASGAEGAWWTSAGSFRGAAAAEAARESVARRTGSEATVLVVASPAGPVHRVALGPWRTQEDAGRSLAALRAAGYEDAWRFRHQVPAAGAPERQAAPPPPAARAVAASEPGARPGRGAAMDSAPAAASVPVQAARQEAGPGAAFRFGAYARLRSTYSFDAAGAPTQKPELVLIPALRGAPDRLGIRAFEVSVRVRSEGADQLSPGRGSHTSVRYHVDRFTEVELRQAWAGFTLAPWRLRLGRQSVVWGHTTGLKVLDIVNPQSLREFLLSSFDGSRVPQWMVNAERDVAGGTLQALLMLDSEGHRLPRAEALYPLASHPRARLASGRSGYRDLETGVRYALSRAGWDVTLNWLRRFDDFPVQPREGAAYRPRMHSFGASAASVFDDYTVRVEALWNANREFGAPWRRAGVAASSEFVSALGVDWRRGGSRVGVQLFQNTLMDHHPATPRDETELTATLLLRQALGRFSAEVMTLRGLSGQGALVRPRMRWQFAPEFSASIYADFFDGDEGAFFGQFDARDRVGLRLDIDL